MACVGRRIPGCAASARLLLVAALAGLVATTSYADTRRVVPCRVVLQPDHLTQALASLDGIWTGTMSRRSENGSWTDLPTDYRCALTGPMTLICAVTIAGEQTEIITEDFLAQTVHATITDRDGHIVETRTDQITAFHFEGPTHWSLTRTSPAPVDGAGEDRRHTLTIRDGTIDLETASRPAGSARSFTVTLRATLGPRM